MNLAWISQWIRQHFVFVITILAAVLIGVSVTNIWSVGGVARNLINPPARILTDAGRGVGSWLSDIAHVGSYSSDNKKLKLEVANLETALNQTNQLKDQNQQLRAFLNFKAPVGYSTQGADVIGYQPNDLRQLVRIDRGAGDGVTVGEPVLAGNVLVGAIDSVEHSTSLVRLVTDPNFRVLVETSATKAPGILIGQGPSGVLIQQIPTTQSIGGGELVLTSGVDGAFPPGLLIGKISQVSQSANTIFKTATVNLTVNLSRLSVLLVLKPTP